MREPFSVQTPADRPYGVLLAFSTASAGVRNVRTDSTGRRSPRGRSGATARRPVNSVGGNQNPAPAARTRRPAVGALGLAGVGQLADPGELLGRVDRADIGVLVQRVADAQRDERRFSESSSSSNIDS
jgi:hypothetical protein